MGGLDACFGRWDTRNHPLADVHPTEFWRTLFPGQDYNNSRVMDFQVRTASIHAKNSLSEMSIDCGQIRFQCPRDSRHSQNA